MGGEAKSGVHLAVAIQVLTFYFWRTPPFWAQFTLNSTHNEESSKKKGQHCFAAPFVSPTAQIVIEPGFRVVAATATLMHTCAAISTIGRLHARDQTSSNCALEKSG